MYFNFLKSRWVNMEFFNAFNNSALTEYPVCIGIWKGDNSWLFGTVLSIVYI